MKFTFGIITDGKEQGRVNYIIDSIEKMNIPEYEVIIIGGDRLNRWIPPEGRARHMPFNEKLTSKGWITCKKNILSAMAKYENIVYLHDYFLFLPGWYEGWLEFGNDFTVANNVVLNLEGTRHSDWVIDPFLVWELRPDLHWKYWEVALPYGVEDCTPMQYISGGYWVAKKQFMIDNPLDNSLLWGDAEDIEWSKRIRMLVEFKINRRSTVQIMKPGKWAPGPIEPQLYKQLYQKYIACPLN